MAKDDKKTGTADDGDKSDANKAPPPPPSASPIGKPDGVSAAADPAGPKAKDATGKTAYMNAPHGFGVHFGGKLHRFNKGLTAIADDKMVLNGEEISLVDFLDADPYVRANDAEVVYRK